MKTYQDLEKAATREQDLKDFIMAAIKDHKSSDGFKFAAIAEDYYHNDNVTIKNYEKAIYDIHGQAHEDRWSPNHKISTGFFRFAVTQENNYLLGNGVGFANETTKGKLENRAGDFDRKVHQAGLYSLIEGVSFAFFNLDHIEVFKLTEFVPLYDEETGALRAGIRFWQLASNKPLRVTLYEEDGYTEYVKSSEKPLTVREGGEKRAYKLLTVTTEADGELIVDGENYEGFPIVPLFANENKQSELYGRRATIDALDLLTSGFVNNVDEGSLVYWIIQNAGGMDDIDDAKFLERLKTTKMAHVDGDGVNSTSVTPQVVEPPHAASDTAIRAIKQRLHEDFMTFNVENLAAGNKTATEINAAYQLLDSKTDAYEYELVEFINRILDIAGIEDEAPTFKRSKIVNKTEEIQTILQAAQYLDSVTITKQITAILGIADQADDIINAMEGEELNRLDIDDEPDQEEETAEE